MDFKDFYLGIDHWSKTDRIAFIGNRKKLSYKELHTRSNIAASYLFDKHSDSECVVIRGEKSFETVIAIYALIKAGIAFIVIPDTFPNGRVDEILSQCFCKYAIITGDNQYVGSVKKISVPAVNADYDGMTSLVLPFPDKDTLAMILFTSGSTGKPKGIRLTQENIFSYVSWLVETCPMNSEEIENGNVVLNLFGLNFVGFMSEFFGFTALFGSTVLLISHKEMADFPTLFEKIYEANPAHFLATPSHLSMLMQSDKFTRKYFPCLRNVALGGEAITKSLLDNFFGRFPDICPACGYGFSECSGGPFTAHVSMEEAINFTDGVPIGKPYKPMRIMIVDENDLPVADGETGELIAIGNMVAHGYHNDETLTKEKFFKTECGERGVRSGDLCCVRNGRYYIVGRKDSRMKIGGYRVDLSEIENVISDMKSVKSCAVVPVCMENRSMMIAACVVLRDKTEITMAQRAEFKKQLKKILPDYMIPQKLVFMDALPLIDTGKKDRKSLEKMVQINP